MKPDWFRHRGYHHFDMPVGERFAAACNPEFVEKHSWLPLIHYVKRVKRYKPINGKTSYKDRDIMYASHRDACILAKYSNELSRELDNFYELNGLEQNVIAYRRLGKSNYDFSAEVYRFCQSNTPCAVLCFDITGFFDNLDHRILKHQLKRILQVKELTNDWYKVFHHVTRFKKIDQIELSKHPIFGSRIKSKKQRPIATISELKASNINIYVNTNRYGIPQGTPISSALSNLYMIDVDLAMASICRERSALYRRYSDDILIVCHFDDKDNIESCLQNVIAKHILEIKEEKTDRVKFDLSSNKSYQYLGFNASPKGATVRPSSLSRHWRRAKRSLSRAKRVGDAEIAKGMASKIYTKKLRRKLSPVGARNFSAYARQSAKAFNSRKIVRQVLRLERRIDQAIRDLEM